MGALKAASSRSTFGRRSVAAIVALFVVVSVAPLAWSQTDDTTEEPTADVRLDVLGTLKRFPSDIDAVLGEPIKKTAQGEKVAGWPFLDLKSRRTFQLYELEQGGVAILVRDLDTFAKVKVIKIAEYAHLGVLGPFPSAFPDGAIEVDEERGRLFLWANTWAGASTPGIVVVDWSREAPRYAFTATPLPDGVTREEFAGTMAPNFTGLTYEPTGRKLFLRTETDPGNGVGFNKLTIAQIDAGNTDSTRLRTEWSRWIRACRSGSSVGNALHSGDHAVLFSPAQRSLFVPCNPGAATAVVRVPLSEAGLPITEEVFNGIGFAMDYLIDRVGQRIHIKITSGPSGIAVLTFDVTKLAYVGLSALVDPAPDNVNPTNVATPMGVNEQTGRVYAVSLSAKYGLTTFEGRLSPVPPGRQFPQVIYRAHENPASIRVDPAKQRIFVPRRGPKSEADGKYMPGDFLILKDLPHADPAPDVDVDSFTADIPEDEGVTTLADYSGGASGYGVRMLLAGGARGVPPLSPFEGTPSDYGTSGCRATDRDFVFGRTERTFLSSAGRNASSIPADTDLATRSDLSEPSRCREARPPRTNTQQYEEFVNSPNGQALWELLTDSAYAQSDMAGQAWPFRRTECPVPNKDGTTREKDTASGQPPFGGSQSSVDCVPTKAQILGSSVARLPLPGSPITFGDAASFTEVVRDPKRGLVSRAIAYVRDLDIGGVVQIDGIYAIAESFASGRPLGSNKVGAGTKYIRAVTGFTSPGYSCGHEGEDPCGDPSALVDGVNRAFVNLGVQLRFPPLEPKLAVGTPGGYQAGVQREFFNSLNAEFANGDILKEVPALEIVRTNDSKNWGRQRQIYQFAGVLANSQYGIRSLGDGFTPPPATGGSTDPVPEQEQELGDVVDGLAPPAASAPTGALSSNGAELPPLAAPVPDTGGGLIPTIPDIARRVTEGIGFLARNPKAAGLMVGAWILLLLPAALAYRRRLLLKALTPTGGTS